MPFWAFIPIDVRTSPITYINSEKDDQLMPRRIDRVKMPIELRIDFLKKLTAQQQDAFHVSLLVCNDMQRIGPLLIVEITVSHRLEGELLFVPQLSDHKPGISSNQLDLVIGIIL